MTRFSGVWFQVEEIPNTYVDVKQCMRTIYQWDGSALQVLTEGLDEYGDMAEQETTISVVIPGNYSQDKPYLQIRSDIVPPVPYHIVDIDYDAFACVYSCFDFLGLKAEIYSILSRSPEASNATLSTCRDSFEALGLSLEKLVSVQQGEQCWYSEGGANTSSTLSPISLAEDEAEDEGFERGLGDALLSAAEEVAGAVERAEEELFGTAEEYHKTTTTPAENKQPQEDLRRRRPKKKQKKKDGSRGRSYPVSPAVSSTPSFVSTGAQHTSLKIQRSRPLITTPTAQSMTITPPQPHHPPTTLPPPPYAHHCPPPFNTPPRPPP
ncbi:crustacyanin-like lipocalin [Penaeus vannamei]|uniref:Crustacyanin-like lipocalin n=1 Tax=Penaeus vannamei TaxID=6689 RepID=A0A3R7N2Y8_PENVA|nr:crustacyanin-like lipocalin [Penaeus vannamei]